jgi:hypothetical protein
VGLALARPRERILYVTFSKAAQLSAVSRFPSNVECRTFHSLAFASHGRPYSQAGKIGSSLRAGSVAHLFPSPDPVKSFLRARFAIEAVNAYCYGASAALSLPVASLPAIRASSLSEGLVIADARLLWDRMRDVACPDVPMSPDGYFKLWSMSRPSYLSSKFGRIVLDEAQDNWASADTVLRAQTCPLAYVGDSAQSIFAFRGSVDSLDTFDADETLSLTRSFRFGPSIAALANSLLSAFKGPNHLRLVGAGGDDGVCEIQPDLPYCIICRTNASVFSHAAALLDSGQRIHLVGGRAAYAFERILDAYHLSRGHLGLVRDPFFKSLQSFAALDAYSVALEDAEIKSVCRVVKEFGSAIPDILRRLATQCIEAAPSDATSAALEDVVDADVFLSTAHRSKGLEFSQVRLSDDFPSIYNASGALVPAHLADQAEVHLLYVALTRACIILEPDRSLRRLHESSLAPVPAPEVLAPT